MHPHCVIIAFTVDAAIVRMCMRTFPQIRSQVAPCAQQDISAAPSSEAPTVIPSNKRQRGGSHTPSQQSLSGEGRSSGQAETRSGDAPRTGGVISRVFGWCAAL